MDELQHECGIAALYDLSAKNANLAREIPQMLLQIQNRGQLAAGMTSYHPERRQLLSTYKDLGIVTQVFRMNSEASFHELMGKHLGTAAIGHVRYATCGKEQDWTYAQPFQRDHLEKFKWFSFAFNGQLANYSELRSELLEQSEYHLARDTDTEVLMHLLSQEFSRTPRPTLLEALSRLSARLDGAYNIVLLNANGDMIVARDPLGVRPLCYGFRGEVFGAASESVALDHLGFDAESIQSLEPGHAVIIEQGKPRIERFAASPRRAHCFFEWIYFANVTSTLDERSVYLVRKSLGEELARVETLDVHSGNTIVVPVPDTAKAAADAMAFQLGLPCLEGLIRNRAVGRTFIEPSGARPDSVKRKYTPLREVLEGKRVLLVEDSIVRSTTLKSLITQLRDRGRVAEIHVRIACPPIVAPCFYGIDMSGVSELFAPRYLQGGAITPEIEAQMARSLKADSLRYLPLDAIARCVRISAEDLCRACLNGEYPTPAGERLYQIALSQHLADCNGSGRIVETDAVLAR